MGAGAARPRMARVIKAWPHVAGRTIAREGSASCVSTSPARWAQTPEKTPAERRPRLTLKPTFSWLNRQLAAEEASRKTSRLREAKRLQANGARTIEWFCPEMLNEDALPASSLAELRKENFESSARRPRETAGRLCRTCNGVKRPSPRKSNST